MLKCDSDLTGSAFFTYQDNDTGTTRGFGAMSNGSSVKVWSGHTIAQFLINESGDVDVNLVCGNANIPIGQVHLF